MKVPTTKDEKLDRINEIVRLVDFSSRDTSLIRELIGLAYDFEGMRKRRGILERLLDKLSGLRQQAAIDRCWANIHSIVSDFSSETACARSSALSQGGSGYQ
jgi:hypothetical protein